MHRDRRTAFTLVELIMVLVVIGVVFAIAAPRFNQADDHRRAQLAKQRIESDIRLAEQDAWHSGQTREIAFDVATSTYEIRGMVDALGNPYVVDLSKPPYSLSLSGVDFGGQTSIILDGRGTDASVTGTVTLSDGNYSEETMVESRESETLTVELSTTATKLLR